MDFTAENRVLEGKVGEGAEKALMDAGYRLSQNGAELADYSTELNETAAYATQASGPGFGLAASLVALSGAALLAYRRRGRETNSNDRAPIEIDYDEEHVQTEIGDYE